MSNVTAALTELASMDRVTLGQRWEAAFGTRAPIGSQATLLRHALAWHVQMQSLGKSRSRRAAQTLKKAATRTATLSPGTRLLREWQGQTYHVTVVAGGFEFNGKVWRSLSAIARSITGTAWSGPAFFGLK